MAIHNPEFFYLLFPKSQLSLIHLHRVYLDLFRFLGARVADADGYLGSASCFLHGFKSDVAVWVKRCQMMEQGTESV